MRWKSWAEFFTSIFWYSFFKKCCFILDMLFLTGLKWVPKSDKAFYQQKMKLQPGILGLAKLQRYQICMLKKGKQTKKTQQTPTRIIQSRKDCLCYLFGKKTSTIYCSFKYINLYIFQLCCALKQHIMCNFPWCLNYLTPFKRTVHFLELEGVFDSCKFHWMFLSVQISFLLCYSCAVSWMVSA